MSQNKTTDRCHQGNKNNTKMENPGNYSFEIEHMY